MIKRVALLLTVAVVLIVPGARAQDHAEVGAFVDYFRLQQTGTNFVGLGGRAAFNVVPSVQIEAEMSYDFGRAFTENFSNGTIVTVQNSNLAVLHGLFGPKIQTKGPVRFFVTAKGGFTNFRVSGRPASFSSFTGSVDNLRSDNVTAAFYPGGGVEGFIGPIGFRAEVGDEVEFLSNGAHNNWKASFGPTFRF